MQLDAEVEEIVNEFAEQESEVEGFGEEVENNAIESDAAGSDQEEYQEDCSKRQEARESDRTYEREPTEEADRAPDLGDEEVQAPQVASQPRLPSKDEQDVHEAMGHAQYRSWCESCIYGQGR